jgi:DNA repair exonuclease SbcCD nuclease subunit
MKYLFTADLHINLRQKNVPKDWALNRYKILFTEIERVANKHNVRQIIFGGDIFDKLPSIEELALFINFLNRLSINEYDTVVYDGNHEATKKGQTFFQYLEPFLPENVFLVNQFTKFTDYDILPYKDLKSWKGEKGNILLTHVRGEIPPHVKPEIDLELFKDYNIVFAGDLHAHSNSQKNIVYPGSPVTVTFHRNKVKTGLIIFDNSGDWEWEEIKVPQLIRKTVSTEKEMIQTDYDHTIYELEGDALDLAKVKDTSILDKKLIKHASEAKLDLKNLSIFEELNLYCSKILKLPQNKLDKVMKAANDYIKETYLE